MSKRRQKRASCEDFMGTTIKVGDYVARPSWGTMFLYLVTKIAYNPNFDCIECDLESVDPVNNEKPLMRGVQEDMVYVEPSRVMLYKLKGGK